MGILDIFNSDNPEKIRAKIAKLEKERLKVDCDPMKSKDDLVNYDLKIKALKKKLDPNFGEDDEGDDPYAVRK